MLSRTLQEETRGPVTVSVRLEGALIVCLEGVLREERPGEWLTPLLDEVTRTASGESVDLILDVRPLSYMNAGSFRLIAAWLNRLKDLDLVLTILCNPEHLWQRVGMTSLKAVGGRSVVVREDSQIACE